MPCMRLHKMSIGQSNTDSGGSERSEPAAQGQTGIRATVKDHLEQLTLQGVKYRGVQDQISGNDSGIRQVGNVVLGS
jgi:hypothetical protein